MDDTSWRHHWLRWSAVERLIALAALAVLARVAVAWLAQLWAVPTRALWVDELVNFTWAWAKAPHWYPHHLTWAPHAVALLPLRLIEGDPTAALVAYRYLNWFALPLGVAPAIWVAGRRLAPLPRLVVAAGGASLLWVWATADVARQNIWALVGLAWLLADDWRSWRSWLGFVATLLYPHVAVFALIFSWWRNLPLRRYRRLLATAGCFVLATLPSALTVAIGLQGDVPTGAAFNNRMPDALRSMYLPLPLPVDLPRWPLVVTLLSTIGLIAVLRRAGARWSTWLPAGAFAAFLAVLGVVRLPPFFSRNVAPIVVFAWLWAAPLLLRQLSVAPRRLALIVGLAVAQALVVLPKDVHWEAARLPASQARTVAAALDPCVIEIGGSMLEVVISLDELMASGLWRPAQPGCEVRLGGDCNDWVFADYEPRFRALFAPDGFSERPASVRFYSAFRGHNLCAIEPPPRPAGCWLHSPEAQIELVAPPAEVRPLCEAGPAVDP